MSLFQKTLNGEYDFPAEVVLEKKILIPKNENTKIAKNYPPVLCLNLMYKLYTSCLNLFMQDHCETNLSQANKQRVKDDAVQGNFL